MDKRWLIPVAVILVAALWWTTKKNSRGDVVLYRGEKIKLSKHYTDFDQYKNDPDNIDPSETKRVQRLVMTAPIAHAFASWSELFQAIQAIAFPGYGTGIFPDRNSDLTLVTIEIPRADKDRVFVVRGRKGGCEVIDEFVHDDIPLLSGVREEGKFYVFFDRSGKELFRRPANGYSGTRATKPMAGKTDILYQRRATRLLLLI